jgi:hypothetical protein
MREQSSLDKLNNHPGVGPLIPGVRPCVFGRLGGLDHRAMSAGAQSADAERGCSMGSQLFALVRRA